MQDVLRLLKYLKPHLGKFGLATFAMLLVGLLESAIRALAVPILGQVLGLNIAKTQPASTLFSLQHMVPSNSLAALETIALLLLAFTAVKGFAEYISTYMMARVGQESVLKLRQDLYQHLLFQESEFFERHRTNYLVSRLVSSAAAIEIAVSATVRDMLRESFTIIAFLAFLFYYSWRLALFSLIIAPLVTFLTARFGRSLRDLARESFEGNQRLVDAAQEALANRNIVKAYLAESREQKRFSRVALEIVRANLRSASINGFAPPTIEMIGIVAFIFLLFLGQHEIQVGRMDGTQFVTFLLFLFSSYDPMRKLSRLQNSLEQAIAAAHHVWEVLDEHAEILDRPSATELGRLEQEIRLTNVNFRYANDEKQILRDINLTIAAGSMLALVGQSGGGKSSLTKLLLRFHDPASGAVLWDGVDLRDARLRSLRRQVALVTQETILFNDTVRYNISYGRPEASEDDIQRAARVAFAHEFIMELPAGYDTLIGERGIFLSGGQRQRLAIARAVLKDASVLVLDEATSALDTESETLVQQALANLTRGRTTVVIAHRLSTVQRADKIVVMERGAVVQMGRHSELLRLSGPYRRLYELQFAGEEAMAGT